MVSKKVMYKAKNNQKGLSINAEIVYPVDEQNAIPMSEYADGLYEAELLLNNNATYVVKVVDKYKLYEIGDTVQLSNSFIRIKNISNINISVFNIVERKESGVYLKPDDETLISLLAYKLQKDDNVFSNNVEIVG